VEGMAIKVGREIVFSNSAGIWELRSRRKSAGNICVDFPESLAPRNLGNLSARLEQEFVVRQTGATMSTQ
jgi:hypothetical protein